VSAAPRWVLASGNAGKLAELRALFHEAGLGIELIAQSELGLTSAREDAATFVENALVKARHAARAAGLPAIADDSGIAVAALDGAPGVRSARYAGDGADDRANVAKLLAELAAVPDRHRAATFHCVLVAIVSADDATPVIATGEWAGEVARAPAGTGGFGYDPVFYDPALGLTAAELPAEVKNRVSHRGRALRALVAALRMKAVRGDVGGAV
jgi:XTP/dITP diphosphohydrolase